ncbi:MAG: DUF4336 domain-containing protein [Oligoflexales bacterium]|nr:DUF4336 domain-containing protein [Oligoflexales bacterium]
MLEYLHDNLWIVRQPLNLLGIDFGTVMTIIRLQDHSLWIHSPIEPSDELGRQLDALGSVKAVVSPNTFHHQYAEYFMDQFPDAHYFYAPGLEKKKPKMISKINISSALSFGTTPEWSDEVESLAITGMPFVNEYVFYHKASCTLIASDLLFNLKKNQSFWHKVLFPLMGLDGAKPSQSRLFKYFIRDKKKYNEAIRKLEQWKIDRIIIGHGGLIEKRAQDIIPELIAV